MCSRIWRECCNHVIAVLYKLEYANSKGLIDPSCTSVAKEVEPRRIEDLLIEKHEKRMKKEMW